MERGLSYNKMADCHQYTVAPHLDALFWGTVQGFGSLPCLRGFSSLLLSVGPKSLCYKQFCWGRIEWEKHNPSLCPRALVEEKATAFTKLEQD